MKRPQPKPMRSGRQLSASKHPKVEANPYLLALYTALVTTIIAALAALLVGALPNLWPKSNNYPHAFSITMQGRTIVGESTNPFENARGYQARVEVCQKYGLEGIIVSVSCYLTIKPSENLTISNSSNPTTAIYQDGSVATICCMAVGDENPNPLYRVQLSRGSEVRRTFLRGEEIHILLMIPDADPGRLLDAITFSPGEGAPTVLFPLGDNVKDHVISSKVMNDKRDDPTLQKMIRDAIVYRDQLRSREPVNRGLTYPQ